MIDLDRETWLYLLIIVAILAFFLWNSNRSKKIKKERKNRNFRKRYLERKEEHKSDTL